MVRGEFSRPYFTLTLPPRLRLSRLVPGEAAMIGAKSRLHSRQGVLSVIAWLRQLRMKVISLMSSGVELVEIVAKEIIQPSERITQSLDQRPHPFWFSGQGEWWSDWYVLSLGSSPPGYKLDPSSARAIVSTAQNDHPRSCGYYTHCEWVHLSDEDVSARFSVMGHHKGDWTGDTNIAVRFKAKVSAEYTLIESIKLSAADFSVLEAKAVPKKPVPEKID